MAAQLDSADVPWWKDAVVYQIYPASFKDSNDDGVGDIPGIISKLDYLQSLGVTALWCCPMYESPHIDGGYDISDYKNVHAPYGTLSDVEDLIEQTHSRGMKVLLDLVINHTSDQHIWSQEAKSSKSNPKRDWYIWKPAKYDRNGRRQPPNNWRSNFGGSVWEWDERTEEYYLHLFAPEQPDLNWENEETRKAIYDEAITFWLEKGVDGFRIDTVNMYSKPPGYPDAEITDLGAFLQEAAPVYVNGPRMSEYLNEINEIMARYDAVSIGECPQTSNMERIKEYVSAKEKQLNMVFQFDIVDVGVGKVHKYYTSPRNYKLTDLKRAIALTQSLVSPDSDGWTTAFMENHDQARSITRFSNDSTLNLAIRSGKMLALLNTCLSGTLFIYQGQELGCINLPESYPIEDYQDLESRNYYHISKQRFNGDEREMAKWEGTLPHGGFTSEGVQPWMKLNPFTTDINAEQQLGDPGSVFNFWKKMLQLRKKHREVFVHGEFKLVDTENESVFSFTKEWQDKKAFVVCNFSDAPQLVPEIDGGKVLLMSNMEKSQEDVLEAWEGRVFLLS